MHTIPLQSRILYFLSSLGFRSPVVDQTELGALVALLDQDIAAVVSLSLDGLEAPDLVCRPAVVVVLDIGADVLAVDLGLPPFLEVLVLALLEGNPLGLAADIAKQPVAVLAVDVIGAAVLLGGGQAAGALDNVNVGDHVGGLVGRVRRALVLRYVERDGGHEDALAHKVADALEDKARLRRIGQRMVLEDSLAAAVSQTDRDSGRTIVHFPLRSLSVFSAGAAMLGNR